MKTLSILWLGAVVLLISQNSRKAGPEPLPKTEVEYLRPGGYATDGEDNCEDLVLPDTPEDPDAYLPHLRCYNRVELPARWVVHPSGVKVWMPERTVKIPTPCNCDQLRTTRMPVA